MLGSITPLGERGRNSRWGLTVAAFITASTAAGTLLGGLLGAVGGLAGASGSTVAIVLLALAILTALAFDLGLGGARLPTVHRQVDEEWLGRYRGWVTGVGFGFQLGLGVATIVTTAFTYVAFLAAGLSGGVATGAVIGAVYGLVRAGTILAGSRVGSPERLVQLDDWLGRWERPAQRTLMTAQVLLLVLALTVAVSAV